MLLNKLKHLFYPLFVLLLVEHHLGVKNARGEDHLLPQFSHAREHEQLIACFLPVKQRLHLLHQFVHAVSRLHDRREHQIRHALRRMVGAHIFQIEYAARKTGNKLRIKQQAHT